MTNIKLREYAVEILRAFYAPEKENYVQGIEALLNTVVEKVNEDWEEWFKKETDEILKYDNYKCQCGRKVCVQRNRKSLSVIIK